MNGAAAGPAEAGAAAELPAALHGRRHGAAGRGGRGPRGPVRPAARHLLRRELEAYGDERFQPLAGISASHIYHLRNSAGYGKLPVRVSRTPALQVAIGKRGIPLPSCGSRTAMEATGGRRRVHVPAGDCRSSPGVNAEVSGILSARSRISNRTIRTDLRLHSRVKK